MGVLLVMFILFVWVGDALGQCVAGTRYTLPSAGYTGKVGVWLDNGSGASGKVPITAMPGNAPDGGLGSYTKYRAVVSEDSRAECTEGGMFYMGLEGYYACWDTGPPLWTRVCMYLQCKGDGSGWCVKSMLYGDEGGTDYDCDGIGDEVDTSPGFAPVQDADGDGVQDSIDPWPNDPSKPGDKKFSHYMTFIRKVDGPTGKVLLA